MPVRNTATSPEWIPHCFLILLLEFGVQDELTGAKDGTNVVFLHTTVDDGDHFQQILAWTLKSRWQQQNEQLCEFTRTFHSEK